MTIRPIHTHPEYEQALRDVAAYFENQPKPGSEEGNRFEILTALIKAYEDEHFTMPDADPIEVLEFVMEDRNLSQSDLATVIGSHRGRASEIMNRIRPLTLPMIRAISLEWKIPIELLSAEYDLAKEYA